MKLIAIISEGGNVKHYLFEDEARRSFYILDSEHASSFLINTRVYLRDENGVPVYLSHPLYDALKMDPTLRKEIGEGQLLINRLRPSYLRPE